MSRVGDFFKKIPWKKIGFIFLILVLMAILFIAGYLLANWYLNSRESGSVLDQKFSDWSVYKSEAYGFGLRYPKDWTATETNSSFVAFTPPASAAAEGEEEASEAVEPDREYISLSIVSNAGRDKTACEEDQSACSFHANDIFGERISTPEMERVFFSYGTNDFYLSVFRYDSSDEAWADYLEVFEDIADSSRFTDQVTVACDGDEDCSLGIRLDGCCSCPEAFSASEIESNAAIVLYESGKDYTSERTADCSGAYCSDCPAEPSGAVCVSNRCQAKE